MKKQLLTLIALFTVSFAAKANDEMMKQIAEFSSKFVMQIENETYSLFTAKKVKHATGTGFIYDFEDDPKTGEKYGIVLTNDHVIGGAPYAKSFLTLHFSGPNKTTEEIKTELVYVSHMHDIAVLKFKMNDLTPAIRDRLQKGKFPEPGSPFYEFSTALQGEPVIALGNPLGETNVTTFGEITGINENSGDGPMILTQAPINPGNSGGPLISRKDGTILGINTQKRNDADNMGYAIPISTALEEYNVWKKNPSIGHRSGMSLNMRSVQTDLLKVLNTKELIEKASPGYFSRQKGALLVADAEPDLKLKTGDLVFRVNGHEVGINHYILLKEAFFAKDSIRLDVVRNNKEVISVEVPIRKNQFSGLRSSLDLVYLSGLIFSEIDSHVTYRAFGDFEKRVFLTNAIDNKQISLNPDQFPALGSNLIAIRINGETKEIKNLRSLKTILKGLSKDTKFIQLIVKEPTREGTYPIFNSIYTVPVTEVMMYPVFNVEAYKQQFSIEPQDFETRNWEQFMRNRKAACEAKLTGAQPTTSPPPPADTDSSRGMPVSTGTAQGTFGFSIPNFLKSN